MLQGEVTGLFSSVKGQQVQLQVHQSAMELKITVLQEVEREKNEKERLAAKAEWLASKRAAREERAKKLRLMSKGASMVED